MMYTLDDAADEIGELNQRIVSLKRENEELRMMTRERRDGDCPGCEYCTTNTIPDLKTAEESLDFWSRHDVEYFPALYDAWLEKCRMAGGKDTKMGIDREILRDLNVTRTVTVDEVRRIDELVRSGKLLSVTGGGAGAVCLRFDDGLFATIGSETGMIISWRLD